MIENKVLDSILKNNLIRKNDKILVGVSGGIDSTALLYILNAIKKTLNIKLHAAHLNHKIRGKQSDQDALFVRNICRKLGIPCTVEEFDVPGFAKQKGLNLEDAARQMRYEFFERVAARYGADKIAVGHTADDNIETFIMKLIRGSGLQGLEGIPQVRGKVIRPLLGIFRKELEDYLKQKGIKAREDKTNKDTKYLRNRVRLDLIPELSKYNRNIKDVILRTIRTVRKDRDFIEGEASKALDDVMALKKSGYIQIDTEKYLKLDPAIQAETIRLAISHVKSDLNDISFINIMDILNLAQKRKGEIDLSGAFITIDKRTISVSRERPSRTKPVDFLHQLEIPGEVRASESGYLFESQILDSISQKQLKMKDPYQAYIDYDKIDKPLLIRRRKEGDMLFPLGLKGKKKLQDIFVDEKVDLAERDRVPVIDDGKNIVWVVGYRISEKAKVTGRTKKIVKITARQI